MNWVLSNEQTPKIDGFYFTEDSEGARSATPFENGMWRSDTGHPVAKWIDESGFDNIFNFAEYLSYHYTTVRTEEGYIHKLRGFNFTTAQVYKEFLKNSPFPIHESKEFDL